MTSTRVARYTSRAADDTSGTHTRTHQQPEGAARLVANVCGSVLQSVCYGSNSVHSEAALIDRVKTDASWS